jgi:hypothetical protein
MGKLVYTLIDKKFVEYVKYPKLDAEVPVAKNCLKCRFFYGNSLDGKNVCCQYESDKL